jgi:hypothetical protein
MSTTGYVSWDDIRDAVPLGIGEQVHINHDSCPAGVDTKRRLYIKNTANAVLAYCHHCDGHYVKPKGKRRRAEVEEELVRATSSVQLSMPTDTLTWDRTTWSDEALKWVLFHHIEDSTALRRGLLYSPSWDRLFIPARTFDECETRVWQARSLTGRQPKYITGGDKTFPAVYNVRTCTVSRNIVITEDMTSAIRIAQDTNCDAMALLGTSLNERHIDVLRQYKKTFVWLDNDAPGVEASYKIRARLDLLGIAHRPISDLPEPKKIYPSHLTQLMEKVDR